MKTFMEFRSVASWLPFSNKAASMALMLSTLLLWGGNATAQTRDGPPFATPSTLPAELQVMLDEHNIDRDKHCTAALTWSEKLEADALAQVRACNFNHNSAELNRLGEGENLAWGNGAFATAKSTIDLWYNEIRNYNFNAPVYVGFPPSIANGHFTQVVWAGSTQLGCAHSATNACFNGGVAYTLWSCRYAPPGNINVAPPATAAQSLESLQANVARLCR
jgi:uncharacterized protein YkwD